MTETRLTTGHSAWQRIWDRIPGWARAGLWGLLLLFILQIAVGVKIWYGLQDPPEVVAVQAPGRQFYISRPVRNLRNPLHWPDVAMDGLRGTSGRDVNSIFLGEQATDELVAYCADHFPNVMVLNLSFGKITAKGLLALQKCPRINDLNVSFTDVDDGLGELLPHLSLLSNLRADSSDVGDGFAQSAAQHSGLNVCFVGGTLVTRQAVAEWQAARPTCQIHSEFAFSAVQGVIRWADGTVSRRYPGKFEVTRTQVKEKEGLNRSLRGFSVSSTGLTGSGLRWSAADFQSKADGVYQMRLKLDEVESEPVNFTVENGVPSVSRIEFQMPVPRPKPPQ